MKLITDMKKSLVILYKFVFNLEVKDVERVEDE